MVMTLVNYLLLLLLLLPTLAMTGHPGDYHRGISLPSLE
jgi:hypothetical protein